MRAKKKIEKKFEIRGPDGKILEYPDNGDFEGLLKHVYESYFSKIPEGMYVCRKCDNPSCINPEHLYLSENKEHFPEYGE